MTKNEMTDITNAVIYKLNVAPRKKNLYSKDIIEYINYGMNKSMFVVSLTFRRLPSCVLENLIDDDTMISESLRYFVSTTWIVDTHRNNITYIPKNETTTSTMLNMGEIITVNIMTFEHFKFLLNDPEVTNTTLDMDYKSYFEHVDSMEEFAIMMLDLKS